MSAQGAGQEGTGGFDWEGMRLRMQRAQAAIAAALDPDPEQIARVLRERAAALSAPRGAEAPVARVDAVAFLLAGERCAVEATYVQEAIALTAWTRVPGVPSYYLGVFVHRGSVWPLVDIRPLLGKQGPAPSLPVPALLIESAGGGIAIAADAVEGLVGLASDAIAAAPDDGRSSILQGICGDGTVLIDAGRLAHDVRLLVNDQPWTYENHREELEK